MKQIFKYPRTQHIFGSKLQKGDEDLVNVPFEQISGRNIIVEEKVDGANSGISLVDDELMLQSRGHYLTGGYRERHFDLLKTWANNWSYQFKELLGERYVMYSEWLYAKHTVYYDSLPHYNMEFDIFDIQKEVFLDTPSRQKMLKNYPFIHSVKVLFEGKIDNVEQLHDMVKQSHFITDDKLVNLNKELILQNQQKNVSKIIEQTDNSDLMEGIYIKVEEDGIVKERYKFVRQGFLQVVDDSETHWLDRPIIPNKLKGSINDLFI